MAISAADSTLLAPLFGDEEIGAIFSDEQFVRHLLQVEAALARVQSRLGLIPPEAGECISAAASGLQVDYEALQAGVDKVGVPVAALVRQLRDATAADAASYVHWGATTQDIMDTAHVLQARAALEALAARLQQVIAALGELADAHRHTLMAGRTHSQQALPIPFDLKVAG